MCHGRGKGKCLLAEGRRRRIAGGLRYGRGAARDAAFGERRGGQRHLEGFGRVARIAVRRGRAAEGGLKLAEMGALFWHCVRERPPGLSRERVGAAIAEGGLARATPVLKALLQQILDGRG